MSVNKNDTSKEGTMKDQLLFLDFETRSSADIKKCGAYKYARDESTHAILLTYALDDEGVQLVDFTRGDAVPEEVMSHVCGGGAVVAWNIDFDREVWNHTEGLPYLNIDQCTDAMGMASAMGLPRAMGKCAEVLIREQEQKLSGTRLINKFCIAKENESIEDIKAKYAQDWAAFVAYAQQDTACLRACFRKMLPLSDNEVRNMRLDMQVNLTGIPLDMDGLAAAESRVEAVIRENAVTCKAIAGVEPTAPQAIRMWVNEKLAARSLPVMESMTAQNVRDMLEKRDTIPSEVATILECRQVAGKTSVAKLVAMRNAQVEGRIHGGLAYHAATTGRAGGRIIQPQNMPRPHIAQPEIEALFDSQFDGANMNDISSCLRGMIAAPEGEELTGADLANIEGRMLAWLAGEEWKLAAFREFDAGKGDDIYKIAAAGIYKCEIAELPKGGRQVGKTAELACGYQGASGAFLTMAKTLGVQVPEAQAKGIVAAWRTKHTATVKLWKAMEARASLVVRYKKPMRVNSRLSFRMAGEHLMMRLPSGRELCYPYAKMKQSEMPWGGTKALLSFYGKDTYTNKWGDCFTYGGKLTENATQAASRDLLYDAMADIHRDGHPIHMHVHDEVVSSGGLSVGKLCEYLTAPRDWAAGLPLAAEGWKGRRFRK